MRHRIEMTYRKNKTPTMNEGRAARFSQNASTNVCQRTYCQSEKNSVLGSGIHEQINVPRKRNARSSTISHGANKNSRRTAIFKSLRAPLTSSTSMANSSHKRNNEPLSHCMRRIQVSTL